MLRSLEVIGEAARNVSTVTHNKCPDIPWARIISFRNRLIHGYFEINLEIVWQIAATEVNPLPQRLSQIVSLDDGNHASDDRDHSG